MIYLYHSFHPTLYSWTFVPTFKNIAEKYKIKFIEKKCFNFSDFYSIPSIDEDVLFITQFDPLLSKDDYQIIKTKFPSSKIIFWGGDTHYIKNSVKSIKWPIDLYLEPMKEVCKDAEPLFKTEHFYWTVSESLLKEILNREYKKIIKTHDLICLCNLTPHMYDRWSLVRNIQGEDLTIQINLNEPVIQRIFDRYQECHVCLGTTTCCMNCETARSMKGFRDWFAPFLGLPLIYDDYQDIVDLKIVPTYRYGNAKDVKELVSLIKNDEKFKSSIIETQIKWVLENTLEIQFEKILLKHNLLGQKNE